MKNSLNLFLTLFILSFSSMALAEGDPNLEMDSSVQAGTVEVGAVLAGSQVRVCTKCQDSNRRLTDGKAIAIPGKAGSSGSGSGSTSTVDTNN